MKLSEVLISIALYVLVSVCFCESFIYAKKSCKKLYEPALNSEKVLSIDLKVRQNIKSIKIPYWKNAENEIEILKKNIILCDFGKDVKVLKCEEIRSSNGNICGLCVSWSFYSKVYETKENFCSVEIFCLEKTKAAL